MSSLDPRNSLALATSACHLVNCSGLRKAADPSFLCRTKRFFDLVTLSDVPGRIRSPSTKCPLKDRTPRVNDLFDAPS